MTYSARIPSSTPKRQLSEVKRIRGTRAHKKAMRTMRICHPLCMRCGNVATETHHVIPMSAGGSSAFHNLEALCSRCHKAQHDPSPTGRKTEGTVPRGGADTISRHKRDNRKTNSWKL